MANRGQLTGQIKDLSKELLGYEITTVELRLMAYAKSVMMDAQIIDPRKCNHDDRKVLARWRLAGYIEGGAAGMAITKEFWDAMSEILWLGYVAYPDQPELSDVSVELLRSALKQIEATK